MCRNCKYFIQERNRCVLHHKDDEILPGGKCDFFKKGTPGSAGHTPLGLTTKAKSNYVDKA